MKNWSGCVSEVSHLLRYFADVSPLQNVAEPPRPEEDGTPRGPSRLQDIGNLLSRDAQIENSEMRSKGQ